MKSKYNLLVVAHPDDESIFCAGLLLQKRIRPWKVICVTDGNADGQGDRRRLEFAAACRKLKVKDFEHWTFRDIYDVRLNIDDLSKQLLALPTPIEVYTHGILGEYGHPHHQDVSLAVHRTFAKKMAVWSMAYNCFPDQLVKLTAANYKIKTEILSSIYGQETRRFAHLLPATFTEGFTKVSLREITAVYEFLTNNGDLKPDDLKTYRWWWKNLQERGRGIPTRPF